MTRLRPVFFWIHLVAGVAAGLIILVLSATGAALAFKPQIMRAIDTAGFDIRADGRAALEPSALLSAYRAQRPDVAARSVTLAKDASAPAAVQTGGVTVYLDPYTGSVLGESSTQAEQMFRAIENWHRWLALQGEQRQTGRAVVGLANVVFLFLAVTGLYLWWPRMWTWRHLRPIVWFRRTSTGRARDFNWHHVAGVWSLPMIVVMTMTGVLMSYPSLNARLQQAVGGGATQAGGPGGGPERGGRGPGRSDMRDGRTTGTPVSIDGAMVDKALAAATQREPAWNSVTVELPRAAGGSLTAFVSAGAAAPSSRSQLSVDATTGEVTKWQPAASASVAQRLRAWVRFGHTGEQWGIVGQTLAAVSCVGGILLVWSGLALAVRRLATSLARTQSENKTVAMAARG